MSGQSKLEIGYWAIRGLGAPCRMVCEFAGADYDSKVYHYHLKSEEKEWDFSEWFEGKKPELQKKNALINLPYLIDTDGSIVTQTIACLSYLGRKYDMMGSNNKELCMTQQVLCEAHDLRNIAVNAFYGGPSEAVVDFLTKSVPKSYAKFEGWLKHQTTGPYTVGETPTVGDFHLWEMVDQCELLAFDHAKDSPLKSYPMLKKLHDSLRAEPKLQRYFSGPLYNLPVNGPMALWGGKARSIGELYYFAVRARGEPLRFLLRYAKIPYADHTVSFTDDWPELKKRIPKGKLPVIMLPNGEFMDETGDLARYIATRVGAPLMPVGKDKQDAAALMFRVSNTDPLAKVNYLMNINKAEEVDGMIAGFIEEMLKALSTFEPELNELKHPFFGGEEPHYGEFGLFHVINLFLGLAQPSPELPVVWMKWYGNMSQLPGVNEYLKERPKAKSGKIGFPGSRIATLDIDA